MTTGVTPEGFVVDSITTTLAQLTAAFQAIFGPDINLDPDTQDGQVVGILAQAINSLALLAQDTYNNPNPDSASGVSLSRLVKLNGIARIAGLFTFNTAQCGGTEGTIIVAGSLVIAQGTNNVYQTMATVTIPAGGSVNVAIQSSIFAAWNDSGSAQIGTPTAGPGGLPGWQTVSIIGPNTPGRPQETDQALRIRRAQSVAMPSQSFVDSLYDALAPANTAGVTSRQVYENNQDVPDPVTGQAPHSLYCIVAGTATEQSIGEVLWLRRSLGVTMLGNTTVAITDSQGYTHDMNYQIPDEVEIWATLHYSPLPGFPSNGPALLQTAIANWAYDNFVIGGTVVWSQFFTAINTVPGVSVTSFYIGTSASPTSENNISVPYDNLASLPIGNIVVVTP